MNESERYEHMKDQVSKGQYPCNILGCRGCVNFNLLNQNQDVPRLEGFEKCSWDYYRLLSKRDMIEEILK